VLIDRAMHAFTGDHVWGSNDGLEAGRDVCWYSWPEQKRSMAALAEHAFVEVFPVTAGDFARAMPGRCSASCAGSPSQCEPKIFSSSNAGVSSS
jgi:hypothetical protein